MKISSDRFLLQKCLFVSFNVKHLLWASSDKKFGDQVNKMNSDHTTVDKILNFPIIRVDIKLSKMRK